MTLDQATWLALGLDAAMVVYTVGIFIAAGMRRRTAAIICGVASGWLIILRALFANEQPFPGDISSTAFFIVILVGVALFGALILGPRAQRTFLLETDQAVLLAPQGIRVFFGAMFLLWAGEGVLPRTFGIVDGFTHISAGFLGLIAAVAASRSEGSAAITWIANIFGLGDILVVATSIAYVLLDDIGPHHPMMYAVFAPAPVWLWLHVVSIYRLTMDDVARTAAAD